MKQITQNGLCSALTSHVHVAYGMPAQQAVVEQPAKPTKADKAAEKAAKAATAAAAAKAKADGAKAKAEHDTANGDVG